jgi:predicted unusual protein kinase regulating ubiquinone biosynthesis (AarF/ABC1/UbiB family)
VLQAFVEDGLIHSDIHLGNISVDDGKNTRSKDSSSNPAETQLSFVLFDVGQFERVGPADTKALLWALGWISTPHRRGILRSVAVKHLVATSSLSSVSCQLTPSQHFGVGMQEHA